MGWVDKYCCWFPASEAPGGVPWNTALPAPKGTCLLATPAQGQWQWNALQRASWPGLPLHCVLLCLQECADLANDNTERALSSAEPQALSLPLCWLFSELEWLHWLRLHFPQGEARRRAGGRKICLSHGLYSSSVWVFTLVDLMEFYFLSVWKFGQKSQW